MTDALTRLAELETAYQKKGRATLQQIVGYGELVAEVYDACNEAGVDVTKWLPEHWGVSANTARNWLSVWEYRALLPEAIAPTVAYKILDPCVSDSARSEIISLLQQGVKVTVAMADALTRQHVLAEGIAIVGRWIAERAASGDKPREIVSDLKSLAEVVEESRQGSGLAISDLLTEAIEERTYLRKQEHIEESYVLHVVTAARMHIEDGREVTLRVLDIPLDLLNPAHQDATVQITVTRRAA